MAKLKWGPGKTTSSEEAEGKEVMYRVGLSAIHSNGSFYTLSKGNNGAYLTAYKSETLAHFEYCDSVDKAKDKAEELEKKKYG